MRAELTTALSLPGISCRQRLGRLSPGAVSLCLAVLAGCAARQAPDGELRAQLRAMGERQLALERKVELLETRLAASKATSARPAAAVQVPAAQAPAHPGRAVAGYPIPSDLAMVTLRPPAARRPVIETALDLQEPEAEVLAELLAEPASTPPEATMPAEYATALEAISNGNVEHGADRLILFVDRNPRHALAAQALFTAGAGLQAWGDPQGAILALERVVGDYPVSEQAPEAMLKLAQCQQRLDRGASARETYAQLIGRYPRTAAAKAAATELKHATVDGNQDTAAR